MPAKPHKIIYAPTSLQSVALQVYGDSSLWYLIADANGITDKNASAGYEGALYIGQRLNISPAALGQYHTNANQMIGNTSATTPLPPPPPPKPQHHSIFAKIVVAVVAVVATVLTAGVMTSGAMGLSALFSAGLSALGGSTAGATLASTLAVGFTAGFVGSIASQGIANAVGMQKGVDLA